MTNLRTVSKEKLDNSQIQLMSQVDDIIKAIESGEYEFDKDYSDCEEPCASDYIKDVLEISYIINQDKSYKGTILLVAFGGPNIYINTYEKQVKGYWGGDEYIVSYFNDKLGLDDYCEEMYSCF